MSVGNLPNFTDLPKNFEKFTGKDYFTKPVTELTPTLAAAKACPTRARASQRVTTFSGEDFRGMCGRVGGRGRPPRTDQHHQKVGSCTSASTPSGSGLCQSSPETLSSVAVRCCPAAAEFFSKSFVSCSLLFARSSVSPPNRVLRKSPIIEGVGKWRRVEWNAVQCTELSEWSSWTPPQ